MADIVRTQSESIPERTQTRLRDMGDGTHAEVLAAVMSSDDSTVDANLQVGNSDVSDSNPVPTTITSPADSATGALEIIDYVHHEVHSGNHFSYTNAQDLTNAQTISFTLVTPNTTRWSHFGFEVNGEAEYDIQIFEGATSLGNVGTPVTNPAVINDDRNSSTANTLVINGTPTLGGGSKGTLIKRFHAGSGKQDGGIAGTGQEIILKQNTTYWVDVTNATTSNNFLSWEVSWYEHTNVT